MFELYNELEDDEDDISEIVRQIYNILHESSKRDAKKILDEYKLSKQDSETAYSEEKPAEKLEFLIRIIYEEKLNLLKKIFGRINLYLMICILKKYFFLG